MIPFKSPKIIAEIGANHKGEMNIAKELIDLASQAGLKYVKSQKRHNKTLLPEHVYNAPHPNPNNSYGATYGEHREFLEFSIEQHYELFKYAQSKGISFTSSVWDVVSAKEYTEINPEFIKVPSACNTNYQLLKILKDDYKGDIHISFGMTTKKEMEDIFNFFAECQERLVIYSCTSGYPVDYKDVCLLEIHSLKKMFPKSVVGFSGHHLGIDIDTAAYTLGAHWIERHFTKDKTWKGTDHQASLEPKEIQNLAIGLYNTYEALTYKKEEILDVEKVQRKKLKEM